MLVANSSFIYKYISVSIRKTKLSKQNVIYKNPFFVIFSIIRVCDSVFIIHPSIWLK